MMIIHVGTAGDGMTLPIPKSLAEQVGIGDNSSVDVSVINGRLVIEPVVSRLHTLELLLEGITAENQHSEVSVGPQMGNESW